MSVWERHWWTTSSAKIGERKWKAIAIWPLFVIGCQYERHKRPIFIFSAWSVIMGVFLFHTTVPLKTSALTWSAIRLRPSESESRIMASPLHEIGTDPRRRYSVPWGQKVCIRQWLWTANRRNVGTCALVRHLSIKPWSCAWQWMHRHTPCQPRHYAMVRGRLSASDLRDIRLERANVSHWIGSWVGSKEAGYGTDERHRSPCTQSNSGHAAYITLITKMPVFKEWNSNRDIL